MPYDLPSKEKLSRLVVAPDGMSHLIAMEGWFWNAFDWMHDHGRCDKKILINGAWEIALQQEAKGCMLTPGNIRAEFAVSFQGYIWLWMNTLIYEEKGISNDV